jgi:hypothetical protein
MLIFYAYIFRTLPEYFLHLNECVTFFCAVLYAYLLFFFSDLELKINKLEKLKTLKFNMSFYMHKDHEINKSASRLFLLPFSIQIQIKSA